MVLVDTSILINIFRNNKTTRALLTTLARHSLAISIVTLAEIELGFIQLLSTKNQQRQPVFMDMIETREIEVVPVDEVVAHQYAQIQAQHLAEGHQLAQFDAVIAATALAHKQPLLTRDGDFRRVNGLQFFPLPR